jgi:ABC-2 type transport system ATP-binding protein
MTRSPAGARAHCRRDLMTETPHAIDVRNLVHQYGRTEGVNGLSLRVPRGRCYGFFGRNGAGKTTTIKCLLNLLRPASGSINVLGFDPRRDEVAVKSRVGYVADRVAFYPWMTVGETLQYYASFRRRWNTETEGALLSEFRLDKRHKAARLSKGQMTQLALVTAICAEPELLVLDEPTSGLDPIVRREFIRTIIGAYQDAAPGERTVFVSTHLISEFEGLIDEFTVIDHGREVLTMDADAARGRYQRIHARFPSPIGALQVPGARVVWNGRDAEIVTAGTAVNILEQLRGRGSEVVGVESLTLEEIFVAAVDQRITA